MILGVHHPALSVPDMAAAIAFYCGKLGFEPVMQAELPSGVAMLDDAFGLDDAGCKVAMLHKGNSCIEVFEFRAAGARDGSEGDRPAHRHGISHICLAADDYDADYAALKEAGVVFNTEPVGGPPSRWAYGRDPFGNIIELLEHDPASPSALNFAR